jgi:hypothetical protein
VVRGTTRTDCNARVNVSLCQTTTGLRPVCSLGRYAPRSAHQTSPRFKCAPQRRVHRPTQPVPAPQEQGLCHSLPSLTSPNPIDWGWGVGRRSSSPAHPDEGPTAAQAAVHHPRIGLPRLSLP